MAAHLAGMAFIPYYNHIIQILETDPQLKKTTKGIPLYIDVERVPIKEQSFITSRGEINWDGMCEKTSTNLIKYIKKLQVNIHWPNNMRNISY